MSREGHRAAQRMAPGSAAAAAAIHMRACSCIIYIYIYTTVSGKIHCTIAQLLKTRPKQNKPGLQRDLPVQAVPGSNHLKTAADTHQEHQHTLLVVSILITS